MEVIFAIFVGLILLRVVGQIFSSQQPWYLPPPNRHCPTCGIEHPTFANYCRRCGRQL